MVDAVLAEQHQGPSTRVGGDKAAIFVSVEKASSEAMDAYRRFTAETVCGPAQHPDWVEAWVETRSAEIIFICVEAAGSTHMMVPLEVISQNGCRVARAIGGNHANGNFPALSGAAPDMGDLARRFLQGLRYSRPEIDLLMIERQTPEINGVSNPFADLPHVPSTNIGLAVDLRGGFDAVIDRIGRKRRMKKHRSQSRKLEAAGGFRRIEARTDAEVDRLLAAFLEQKADRFQKLGIGNVFADMQPFLSQLFKRALRSPEPAFLLHGLEVNGSIRAVTGSSLIDDRLVCEFGSIIEDEIAHASPGDFLFFLNIEEAACKGLSTYDFSVGDEPYKRGWCDVENHQFDTIAPLSFKGRIYALALQGVVGAKRRIKSNETVWAAIKKLRRGATRSPATISEADD